MKQLLFVRHAQSFTNAGGITMERDIVPLTPLGQLQAEELAEALDIVPTRVLVSRLLRAQQSAEPFCVHFGLQPEVWSCLDEFSMIDLKLIAGYTREQRTPVAEAYWAESDPHKRMGVEADTFLEFYARVTKFHSLMHTLPDATVIFGHSTWFSLLVWRLLGHTAEDGPGMARFRRFLLGLPVPNGSVYRMTQAANGEWSVHFDTALQERIDSVGEPAALERELMP
jgi:broad specificity phosphatase PhoE